MGAPPFTTDSQQIGQVATAALAFGGGTSSSPLTTATADKNFLGFWTQSTATSGDSRGAYIRHYFAGAGGAGEALRAYGTVSNVSAAGTVNGAHISLSVTGASGKTTGAGNAIRATLDIGASCAPGGTLAAIQVDSNFDAAATVPSTCAGLRFSTTGSSGFPYVMAFDGVNAGVWDDDYSTEVTTLAGALKVLVNGSVRYIGLYSGAPS